MVIFYAGIYDPYDRLAGTGTLIPSGQGFNVGVFNGIVQSPLRGKHRIVRNCIGLDDNIWLAG